MRVKPRVENIRRKLQELRLDALLITHLPNVRYLTGFSGTSGLCIIGKREAYFVTDFRYQEQSRHEVEAYKIFIAKTTLFDAIKEQKLLRRWNRVGIEGNYLPYAEYQKLRKLFPSVRFFPHADVVENFAMVKEKEEIKFIQKAASISDRVFKTILDLIRPGVRELEISAEISYLHKKYGADGDAFETIVASGPRSALPHGVASEKKIRAGELLTLDFGCVYHGYACDMTRTVAVGKPREKAKEIYQIVFDAQQKAIEAAKGGILAKELDAIARGYIESKGYGKYFGHSLGHGLGLQVHEPPRISSQSSYRLQEGNVITIEPGIYLPGFGGVRIEDDVVLLNGSCRVLNTSPKELMIL